MFHFSLIDNLTIYARVINIRYFSTMGQTQFRCLHWALGHPRPQLHFLNIYGYKSMHFMVLWFFLQAYGHPLFLQVLMYGYIVWSIILNMYDYKVWRIIFWICMVLKFGTLFWYSETSWLCSLSTNIWRCLKQPFTRPL